MTTEPSLPPGVSFSAKKTVKRAVEDGLTAPSMEDAISDLWNAVQNSPIDLVDQATGETLTFAQFSAMGTSRAVKKIEKLARRVRKTTKGLAGFIDMGGSLEVIWAEIAKNDNELRKSRASRRLGTRPHKRG